MRRSIVATMVAGLVAGPLTAAMPDNGAMPDDGAMPVRAMPRERPAPGRASLPGNTEIWLATADEVSSKRLRPGGRFALRVARDVMLGDYVVIPRGTPAWGQVSWRTGKGAFGKSAKMEFDLVGIDLDGRTVPVSGHYRVEGEGNTGAAIGAVVAVGVLGGLVTGHSAVVAAGTEYRAYTREVLALDLSASAAPARLVSASVPAIPTRYRPSTPAVPVAMPVAMPVAVAEPARPMTIQPLVGHRNGRDDGIEVPM